MMQLKTLAAPLRTICLTAVAAGVLLATTAANAQKLAAGEYSIGFITEITGPLAAAGISYWRGAQLAAEEINAEGWLGKGATLALVAKESGSDAARAVQALTQFAADRNVVATTCCIISPVAGALRPVAVNAKIPLVLYGATRPGLPQLPFVSSVVVLPGPSEVKMMEQLVKVIKPKTVTFFVNADNDAFQDRFKAAQKATESAGVKTGGVVSILSNDTDFTAPATQAMATNPDMISVFTTQTPAVGIISALRARGYKGPINTSDVISPPAVFKKAGEAVVGIPFPIQFSADVSSTKEAKSFVANYEKKNKDSPDTYSAQGYTAIYYIAQGLRSMEGKPTREGLAETLAKIKSVDRNVYGGLPMIDGQADVHNSMLVAWAASGKIVAWEPK
jgi:ABC-type branched-subunit amino acid transport system substrate-binding protein